MITDPRSAARRPYPRWTYFARAAWTLIEATLWKLAWKRLHMLRPGLLRLFGAEAPARCLISGSVSVYFPWLLSLGSEVAIAERVVLYNLGGITGAQTHSHRG